MTTLVAGDAPLDLLEFPTHAFQLSGVGLRAMLKKVDLNP